MDSFAEVFNLVKEYVRKEVSPVPYDLWITPIQPVGFEDGKARLSVNSSFMQDVVSKKYLDVLSRGFSEVMGFPAEVEILCIERPSENPILAADEQSAAFNRYSPEEIEKSSQGGDYEYTFATFIVGNSNKFAHAAAQAVAANPAKAYNPLFIYGGSGLGKTHLMLAIMNENTKMQPDYNFIYIKGEEFTNQIVEAIRNDTTDQFHNKYRSADVLLVDDIQFIGGKERTQEEFFHTFEALHQNGKQIVLTSDRPPKEIKTLEDRLKTRFEWGLLADIQPPDFETRVAIVRRKAELMDLDMPPEVSEYIANKLKSNIRQLEGVVKKLKAYKLLVGSPTSILIAQNAIRDIFNDSQPLQVTVERILTEVARTYGISPEEIRSSKRAANISLARQVSAYVIREVTQSSMQTIGDELGNRDHSTIVYAISQVEKRMKTDTRFKETVEDIIKNIQDS